VGVDELPVRQRGLELGPQAVDVDVDGTVTRPQRAAPGQAVELLARDDPVGAPGQRHQHRVLEHREDQRAAVGQRQVLAGPHLQRPDPQDLRLAHGLHRASQPGARMPARRYPAVNEL
jgi:hypothetical protein